MHTLKSAIDRFFDATPRVVEHGGFTINILGHRISEQNFETFIRLRIESGTGSTYGIFEEMPDTDRIILGAPWAMRLVFDSAIKRVRAHQMRAAMESMVRLWGLSD
jgi:hypothetical protein